MAGISPLFFPSVPCVRVADFVYEGPPVRATRAH